MPCTACLGFGFLSHREPLEGLYTSRSMRTGLEGKCVEPSLGAVVPVEREL